MTRPAVKQSKLDPRARKVAFQKRKAGLIKIMNDLKTLCGVDGCLVMYETPDAPAKVWPSHSEAVRLIQEYEDAKMSSPNPELDPKAFHSLNTRTCLTVKYKSKDEEIAALLKKRNELMIFKAELDRQIKLEEEKNREN